MLLLQFNIIKLNSLIYQEHTKNNYISLSFINIIFSAWRIVIILVIFSHKFFFYKGRRIKHSAIVVLILEQYRIDCTCLKA